MDVVATIPLNITDSGNSNLSFAGNYTKTEVVDFNPVTLDETRIRQLEENLPRWRGNATFTHATEKWRVLTRVNYYGKYWEAHLDAGDLPINASSEITFDAEFGYNVMENLEVIVGANNLFDNYPDANPWGGVAGAAYPVTSPMGFNGGYYYARARFTF